MRRLFAVMVALAALVAARPAGAQGIVRTPPPRPPDTVHAFGIFEAEAMLAHQSFSAVLADGTKSTLLFGGAGVEATKIWKGLFARFAATHTSNKGSRVFVDASGNAVSLDLPLTIEVTPIEIGGGWRFVRKPRPVPPRLVRPGQRPSNVAVVPYLGAAVLVQRYKETSDIASPDENVSATDTGESFFAGVELGFGVVRLGFEGQFRNVPNVLGAGGISQEFGETNLGGGVIRVTLGVGF